MAGPLSFVHAGTTNPLRKRRRNLSLSIVPDATTWGLVLASLGGDTVSGKSETRAVTCAPKGPPKVSCSGPSRQALFLLHNNPKRLSWVLPPVNSGRLHVTCETLGVRLSGLSTRTYRSLLIIET